ncbi:response regulator transcription factor [Chitinilyticum piscinae]|uniref:Response regulator transcription factor n=1 Tax=Chitinilyticum piscinae TaxID=2866724 RepID=A0A8J7K2C2_9NEIS|nr:response regulator transcription factor [Chitinilyticum piscinae]MBE9609832.1 response regulator transcription factor [Chitinilyticum piscinae]
MRILLIEDEAALRDSLARRLEADGYRVDVAADGEDGLYQASEYPCDLLIVDLGLPRLNGLGVIRQLRQAGQSMPILVLTARGSWQDKVAGLEAGADDYLTKPFEYPELAARVMALLRRALKATSTELQLGQITIDFSRQRVSYAGQPVELTAFEYRLLELLVQQRERVVSKQELSDYLYPHDEDRDSNVIEVLIARLRRKLDPLGECPVIETLRGRGYRLVAGSC